MALMIALLGQLNFMTSIQDICDFLDWFAPQRLAEEWDNVGLLVGDRNSTANRVMTCLTITPASAAEAINKGCDLIVSHHPLPFQPLKKITADAISTRMLLDLIRAEVAVYSPHTGFDSAAHGINQSLAELVGMENPKPIIPIPNDPDELGSGRIGNLNPSISLAELVDRLKASLSVGHVGVVGQMDATTHRIALACGSGGTFLESARQLGCDTFVTGEANFHTCLEAEATNTNLILLGHYASERFALERLASELGKQFPEVDSWPSVQESDPLKRY